MTTDTIERLMARTILQAAVEDAWIKSQWPTYKGWRIGDQRNLFLAHLIPRPSMIDYNDLASATHVPELPYAVATCHLSHKHTNGFKRILITAPLIDPEYIWNPEHKEF